MSGGFFPLFTPFSAMKPIRIWDLPTRLFHWSFVVLALTAYVTAKTGGNAMIYHFWCGYAILALLMFRLVWGLVGPRYARFCDFMTGPRTFFKSLRAPDTTDARFAGHTPLGGLSVIAMLLFFGIQAVLGLFSNDDIFNDGPLVKFIDKDLSDWLIKDLITPMIVGDKPLATPTPPARDDWRVRAGALVLIVLASAVVYRIVHLTPAVASLPSY
jgi:hypothetical protein